MVATILKSALVGLALGAALAFAASSAILEQLSDLRDCPSAMPETATVASTVASPLTASAP
jgi:hypothetical protein